MQVDFLDSTANAVGTKATASTAIDAAEPSPSERQTYWRRVRYDEENGGPPWVLRELPDRGLVAFATRDFSQGEWICSEFPVVWIQAHHPFSAKVVAEIEAKIDALPCEADKEAFYAMANVYDGSSEQSSKAAGIFMTNSFDMTGSSSSALIFCSSAFPPFFPVKFRFAILLFLLNLAFIDPFFFCSILLLRFVVFPVVVVI